MTFSQRIGTTKGRVRRSEYKTSEHRECERKVNNNEGDIQPKLRDANNQNLKRVNRFATTAKSRIHWHTKGHTHKRTTTTTTASLRQISMFRMVCLKSSRHHKNRVLLHYYTSIK